MSPRHLVLLGTCISMRQSCRLSIIQATLKFNAKQGLNFPIFLQGFAFVEVRISKFTTCQTLWWKKNQLVLEKIWLHCKLHFVKVQKTKLILNYTNDSKGRNHKTTFTCVKFRFHWALATMSHQLTAYRFLIWFLIWSVKEGRSVDTVWFLIWSIKDGRSVDTDSWCKRALRPIPPSAPSTPKFEEQRRSVWPGKTCILDRSIFSSTRITSWYGLDFENVIFFQCRNTLPGSFIHFFSCTLKPCLRKAFASVHQSLTLCLWLRRCQHKE